MANNTRCGYVAILGIPNAGKSTLLNHLVGSKLAIVTPKAQTTRNRIMGFCMHEQSQIIFMDTPGIFDAKQKFEKAMVASAWGGAADADMLLLMIDAAKGINPGTQAIIDGLAKSKKPAIAVVNKIDAVDKNQLLAMVSVLNATGRFTDIFMISALQGDGVKDVKAHLAAAMPEGPWLYPEDQVSDISMRLLAAEITREKLFMKLVEELPYSLTVETEQWDEGEKDIKIHQLIIVQKETQKKIVIGAKGAMLKAIGEASRHELGRLLGKKVHLFLFVKVKEDWKEKPDVYSYLGLDFKS